MLNLHTPRKIAHWYDATGRDMIGRHSSQPVSPATPMLCAAAEQLPPAASLTSRGALHLWASGCCETPTLGGGGAPQRAGGQAEKEAGDGQAESKDADTCCRSASRALVSAACSASEADAPQGSRGAAEASTRPPADAAAAAAERSATPQQPAAAVPAGLGCMQSDLSLMLAAAAAAGRGPVIAAAQPGQPAAGPLQQAAGSPTAVNPTCADEAAARPGQQLRASAEHTDALAHSSASAGGHEDWHMAEVGITL
jgi:hypothetical protein